ncbi:ABC transporter substrate-binding protein [Oxalobacteraceae bacterium]|nr:ABC transporter substrate-binding protein [Oxalobacteraceae bacterium]
MDSRRRALLGLMLALGAGGSVAAAVPVQDDDGVAPHELRIGMANALTGPAAGLGLQLRAGANAYLSKVNALGGVHGRRLKLISVDDGYDPTQSVLATKALIGQHKAFVLFGYVGTPTSAAAVPLAQASGVPYLFPFSGAQSLRNPVVPVVFNLRASYYDEAEALVAHLNGELGLNNIGVFIQDDEYGEAGKAGVVRALAKRNLKPSVVARYERNTLKVEAGLNQLIKQAPEAVVFFGTYRPLAQLVKKARAAGLKTRFLTVSFIGTSEFIKHAGAMAEGVVISQVFPSPDSGSEALIQQYQADVAPGARNYGSLEGYADAVVLVEALRRCGPQPSRARLLKVMEELTLDLGGLPVAFSAHQHQGMDRVYLSWVRDGKVVPLPKK